MLAEIDVLNQPEISISEIRATTTTIYTTLCFDTLGKIAKKDAEYQQLRNSSFIMVFLTIAPSYLTPVNDTGLPMIISLSMMISLYMDADCSSQSVCSHKC